MLLMLQTFIGAVVFVLLVGMCVYAVGVLWDVLWLVVDRVQWLRSYAREHPEYDPPNKLLVKIVLYGARRQPAYRKVW